MASRTRVHSIESSKAQYEVCYEEKIMELQGLAAAQMIEEGFSNEFNKLEKRGVTLQVIEEESSIKQEARSEPPEVQSLLKQYADVFCEPKGLPTPQTHDHAII